MSLFAKAAWRLIIPPRMSEKRSFRLERATGEASLVSVARRAKVEGVWVYQDGEFRDISHRQDRTRAAFVIELERKTPFTVYHIHPSKVGSPGGHIDIHRGYKVSPPSLEDFAAFVALRRRYGELASCRVADGWGVWSFALTDEALKGGLVETLTDKQVFQWIRTAYVGQLKFKLDPPPAARRAFRADLKQKGLILDYATRAEIDSRLLARRSTDR